MSNEINFTNNKIGSGSYDLNKWLYGGYEKDIITTISGSSGTGKTNLCLIVAASQAMKGKKVIFIDTEGGFSSERIKQIITSTKKVGEGEYGAILGNLLLLKPTNFKEQKESFEKLLKEIRQENNIGLIIIDGMTMLYRLELGETNSNGDDKETKIKETNRELARQLRVLAEISRKKNIPVIVTNQVYNKYISAEERDKGVSPEVRMVGGDLLKYWSKCIIQLENNNGRRRAILIKHRSMGEKELDFTINNAGIKKRGWI